MVSQVSYCLYERWHPIQILAEQNSIGQPVIEQLTRDGLRIHPFTTTNARKALAVEALALAFERGDIRILSDAVLVSELVAYQAEQLPSGLIRYGSPSGQHDDCVMALAIAWSAVCGQQRAIYPVPESDIIVKAFDIPPHWRRAYGLEIGPCSTAAIWGALDRQSDVLYLYDEYYGLDCETLAHAQAIRSRGNWIGAVDPAGGGRHPIDGYRIIQLYRDLGLRVESVNNLVDSGTLQVRQRMSTGRLKVFETLKHYREELRCYRRDEKGQIPMEGNQLQNAARCLVVGGTSCMRVAPVPKSPEHYYQSADFSRHPWGWMRS